MTAPDDTLAALRDAFAFNWEVRSALLHAIGRLPWSEATSVKAPHARSVRDAFLDILETEAYWAHHVLDNGVAEWRAYDRSDATSAERLALHAAGVQRMTAERLARLPPGELAKPRPAPEPGQWSAGDVLLRVLTGTLLDAGLLAGRLKEMGVSPAVPKWTPRAR